MGSCKPLNLLDGCGKNASIDVAQLINNGALVSYVMIIFV